MNAVIAELAQLHFLRPWWLLVLLALPLLGWRQYVRMHQRSAWREAVDAHLLPELLQANSKPAAANAWPLWIGLLGLALAVVAMAGPSFRKDALPLWHVRQPLVVALDLSSSALARDLPPTRLAQARAKLATLLRERAGGQVALVVFAGDAYTVAPLTDDAANVALFLDALTPDVMPEDGQRVDRAIAWSQQLLRQAGYPRGDIVLMTDHADAADLAAAAQAHAAGYRVSALGVGSAHGGVFATATGLRQARLDAPSLRMLAASGGGRFQPLTIGNTDLQALGLLVPQQEGGTNKQSGTLSLWRDDGYWLLPLALLCLLPLYRRGGGLVAVLLCLLWWPPAQAQQGTPALGGLWQRADQAEYAQRQQGIAAYQRKDFQHAIAIFERLPAAEDQYNLGNALAQAGRYGEAIAAYDRVLKRQPAMVNARYNRRLVEAVQQQNQQQQNQSAKPQRAQPQDQIRADAAQQQRMRQALGKQRPDDAKQQSQQQRRGQETSQQRERRLANQAWLQRVPDDPGALLRARFQLEAQRRREGAP